MTTKADPPKPRRPRPASRELRCGICGQPYTYPLKGRNATRRLCVECAALPASVKPTLMQMGKRIRELEKELKTLSDKLNTKQTPPNGDSP
ncbi:MAG: hypothetical protein WD708_06165 [Kiritimatiellia bacterium]